VDGATWLNPRASVCDWDRITCTGGSVQTIVETKLANMEGYLPSELNALVSLQQITLNQNRVRGLRAPLSKLCKCTGNVLFQAQANQESFPLTPVIFSVSLSLQDSALGELSRGIPSEILQMTNLRKSKERVASNVIKDQLTHSKNCFVDNLYLAGNSLLRTVSTEISKLSSLGTFAGRKLTQNVSFVLTVPFLDTSFSVILDLSQNSFTGTLSNHLQSMANLTDVSLAQNQFEGNVMEIIKGLSNLRK
jgi:hypothetical protein